MSRFFRDSSTENADIQENCVKHAVAVGAKSAAMALAVSTTVILGSCKAFPRFGRALGVSARTALIASPAFGFFFLDTELELNACAQRHRHMQRSFKNPSVTGQ
ncbi:hypothetical protein ACKKBG_A32990 [Auxenochlorella protothecoides x Auxenochlorella symbiontica]